jgi:hypothetical protein
MQKTPSGYVYSPSDLIAFLENEAVTWPGVLDSFMTCRRCDLNFMLHDGWTRAMMKLPVQQEFVYWSPSAARGALRQP